MLVSTSGVDPPLQEPLLWAGLCQWIFLSENKKYKISFILVEVLFSGGVMRPFSSFLCRETASPVTSCPRDLVKCKGEASGLYWETLEVGKHIDWCFSPEHWAMKVRNRFFNSQFGTLNTCRAETNLSLRAKSLISCYQFANRMFNLHVIQFSHCWHWRKFVCSDSLKPLRLYLILGFMSELSRPFSECFALQCVCVICHGKIYGIKGEDTFEKFFNCIQKPSVRYKMITPVE